MWSTHTIPYVLFATLGTFVVKNCKNVITFTMSESLSVLRTPIRTFMRFDAELYWRIPVLVEIEHKRRTPYVNKGLHVRYLALLKCSSIYIYWNEKYFDTNLYKIRNTHFLLRTLFLCVLRDCDINRSVSDVTLLLCVRFQTCIFNSQWLSSPFFGHVALRRWVTGA